MTVKKLLKLAELFEETIISLAQDQQQPSQRPPPQFTRDEPYAARPDSPIGKLYNATEKVVKKVTNTLGVDMSPEAIEKRHEQYQKIDPIRKLYEATQNAAKQVGEKLKLDMRPEAVEKRNQEFLKWFRTTQNYVDGTLTPAIYERWLRQKQ